MRYGRYVVIAVACTLLLTACGKQGAGSGNDTATSEPVTKEEMTTYLEWAAALKKQMLAAMAEARQNLSDNDAFLAMAERRRKEQAAIIAREPFKDTPKGKAITSVIQTLYDSGTFVRDEKQLDRLRAAHGEELIDSILAHEGMIREHLDPDGLSVGNRALAQ